LGNYSSKFSKNPNVLQQAFSHSTQNNGEQEDFGSNPGEKQPFHKKGPGNITLSPLSMDKACSKDSKR